MQGGPIFVTTLLISITWIIFSTLRRYKIAKLQADLQAKLLDKIGTGQELLSYAQTDAGRQLMESLKVERVAPHGRIIGAIQAGIVLSFFGAAVLLARSHASADDVAGFTIFGMVFIGLGLGFVVAGSASYYLSKSFGLFNGASNHGK
jgi:hypothetical protein